MLKPGDAFERYTIEALIGQGGMGCVYRAHDPRLGRRVALKVINDGSAHADANARLVREARAAAALDHPNAVAIFDVGALDGAPYIVMELVEGRTLRNADGDATAPIPARIAQLGGVARALAGAHKRGLIHRDIKPENVMVRDDGEVKVLDFGIARRTGGSVDPRGPTHTPALPTLTVEGVKLGTPVYMAPEQIRGDELDGRTDQFAWGVLAYELLAGRLPWRGAADALAVMASVLTDTADSAPLAVAGVSPAIVAVVLRALEKRPEDRFASMDDLLRALDAAGRGEAPAALVKAAPASSATMAQQFSTSEVREVLGKAIEQQAAKQGSTRLGFDELIAVAAEVGVDVGSLREASRALRSRSEEQSTAIESAAKRDAWLRQERMLFYRHAGIYLIVNAALLVLGLVLLSFTPWWIWFLAPLAWSVGLAIHGLMAMTTNEGDWNEHNEGMKAWHESRRRRHEVAMARAKDPRALGARREEPRGRVEATPEQEKLRVAMDTGRDRAAAEEEAGLAEEPEVRRRRR
jgi:eukaryotic-like serine/threonine-protein kinase